MCVNSVMISTGVYRSASGIIGRFLGDSTLEANTRGIIIPGCVQVFDRSRIDQCRRTAWTTKPSKETRSGNSIEECIKSNHHVRHTVRTCLFDDWN